jgi:restriction endonuclease S subunit
MKQILITLSLCVSSLCFSQDTLQIPAIELEEFFLALDTLETQDSIKTILIGQLEKQIEFHLELNDHNENLISYKDQEIELLNNQIDLHLDHLNQVDKWYKKPWTGAVGILLLLHVVDYTLPQ